MRFSSLFATVSLAASALAHYTLPTLIVNGQPSGEWVNIRRTNNYNTQAPVQDVTSPDFTCYTSETHATATTAEVAAGSSVSIKANGPMYHAGVVNVYMASANPDAASYDGSGQKWFKVYEIPPVTNGGSSISFPGSDIDTITFTIPKSLPSGEYLIRAEHIALHSASSFGGAQFYLSCAQVKPARLHPRRLHRQRARHPHQHLLSRPCQLHHARARCLAWMKVSLGIRRGSPDICY
ncbi:glycosyl hydrolase family 61-domain-containing protein [Schizophyllum commune]